MQLGDKALAFLRSNPTAHQVAEHCKISLKDAYELQHLYQTFWQTVGKLTGDRQ